MSVFCYNEIDIGGKGTINEFAIVRIIRNQWPMEENLDLVNVIGLR